jgi:hypothetical protein
MVMRSGSFDPALKYVLCAPSSLLSEHELEPVDATYRGAVWQIKQAASSSINGMIAKDVTDKDVIQKLMKKIVRPEHAFSNAKTTEVPLTVDIREAYKLLGERRTGEGEAALLKFLLYGYVAREASRLGKTAAEIANSAFKSLRVKNRAAFLAHVKSKHVPMTRDAAKAVYDMQKTSVPKTALNFAWKAVVGNRPDSLACCETGCNGSLGALIMRYLKPGDFPISMSEVKRPKVVIDPKASCMVIPIKRGWYDMLDLIRAAGYEADDDTSLLAKSRHPVKFNYNPKFESNKAWWPVGLEKPLMMLFDNHKFKFDPIMPVSRKRA